MKTVYVGCVAQAIGTFSGHQTAKALEINQLVIKIII